MNQQIAPIFEQLLQYNKKNPARFHVPGHQSGDFYESDQRTNEFFRMIMSIDTTELDELDDLHDPQSIILNAQKLAADCFDSEQTFFLVNGSTVGNLAAILTICDPGDTLIVDRRVHKSVIHGLMLAGAQAVFVASEWDESQGEYGGISVNTIKETLQLYPQAKGVFLTYPDYYGRGIHIQEMIDLVHQSNRTIILDQAHGAHYGFHTGLPQSGCKLGADIVVQSTHKMLSALTMGAMLHVSGNRVDRDQLSHHLHVLQSSSPSYPIMASLDIARREIALHGQKHMNQGMDIVQTFRETMSDQIKFILNPKNPKLLDIYSQDPFKILIMDRGRRWSGYQLQKELAERNCYLEMADSNGVLAVFSPFTKRASMFKLVEALREISIDNVEEPIPKNHYPYQKDIGAIKPISEPIMFQLKETKSKQCVPLNDSIGKLAAEMIVPYPPGVPMLFPGETITRATVDWIKVLKREGANFQGKSNLDIDHHIWIYHES